jgi:hypothetical protein
MARHADDLLGRSRELAASHRQFLLTASLVGNILSGELDRAQGAWDRHSAAVARGDLGLDLRLLYAYLAVAKSAAADRPS